MLMMSTCMSQVRLGEYSRADGYYKLLLAHLVPKVCVYLYIYMYYMYIFTTYGN